jgi:hypothetical protein
LSWPAAGYTAISSGLTADGQPTVECAAPCPANYFPFACGGYCTLDSSLVCPLDQANIRLGSSSIVSQCADFKKVVVSCGCAA